MQHLDEILQLPDRFRERAETDGAHDRVAGLVWRQAADLVGAAVVELLEELLTVAEAASEYGWSYEALRRRIAAAPELNAGEAGKPLVARATMERLGRGRGPQSRQTEGPQEVPPSVDDTSGRLQEILERAAEAQGT